MAARSIITKGKLMSFVGRELEKLGQALLVTPDGERYAELYAAQQALAWALDPTGFKSPHAMITGDCSVVIHRSPLPDTPPAEQD